MHNDASRSDQADPRAEGHGNRSLRWLFLAFLERELKNRFLGSVSGLLWAVLQPALLLAIYAVVFTQVFRVGIPDLAPYSFTTFVAIGLWPWMAFSEALTRGLQAPQNNGALIKKVAFPSELVVYAAVTGSFVVHLAGFAAVLALLAFFGQGVKLSGLPTLLLALCALYLLATALALALGGLQVFVRDVEHVMGPVLMILFYATPILYSASMIPEHLRDYMAWNPLAWILDPTREALLRGATGVPVSLAVATVAALALAVAARALFRRLSPHFESFL